MGHSTLIPLSCNEETLSGVKCAVVTPTELDQRKVEKVWQLRLPTNSSLRCLLSV